MAERRTLEKWEKPYTLLFGSGGAHDVKGGAFLGAGLGRGGLDNFQVNCRVSCRTASPQVDQSDAQVHNVYRLVGPFLYNRRKIN